MAIFKPPKVTNLFGGQSVGGNLDDDLINFMTGGSNVEYVNAHDAVKNSDIYSLVSQVSGDLASAKLGASKKKTQGLLNNPDPRTNEHAFWQGLFAQLLLNGETFAYRWRNRNGADVRLEQLRPSQVQAYVTQDRSEMFYQVTFDDPNIGVQVINAPDMIHVRLMSIDGGLTGISPLASLANELQVKQSSDELTIKALKQSIMANAILKITHGGLLDWKMKAARSRSFMKQYESSDGGPIVIDDLEEYQPLEIKNNVAQLLNQVNWTSAQIAKVYGIPDSYLAGQGDQQSSSEQLRSLYANALNRFMETITSELTDKLGTQVKADLRRAIDPLGDGYLKVLTNAIKSGVFDSEQIDWLLRDRDYIPADTPKLTHRKGGEDSSEED